MRALLAAVTAFLTLGLAGAVPAEASEAHRRPAAPTSASASHRAAAAPFTFDVWFNGYGTSPKTSRHQGDGQEVDLFADCDSDIVAGQLYHVTWGRDRPVGNVVKIPCNGGKSAVYNLSGGEYYFYFLSGVNNTQVVGYWR